MSQSVVRKYLNDIGICQEVFVVSSEEHKEGENKRCCREQDGDDGGKTHVSQMGQRSKTGNESALQEMEEMGTQMDLDDGNCQGGMEIEALEVGYLWEEKIADQCGDRTLRRGTQG